MATPAPYPTPSPAPEVFILMCYCGTTITTPLAEGTCHNCGRGYEVQFRPPVTT